MCIFKKMRGRKGMRLVATSRMMGRNFLSKKQLKKVFHKETPI